MKAKLKGELKGELVHLTCRDEIDKELELTAYVLEQLSPQLRKQFEEKLVNSENLQGELAQEIKFKNRLLDADTPVQGIEPDFAKLEKQLAPISHRFQWRIAVALLLFLGAGGYYWQSSQSLLPQNQQFETLTQEAQPIQLGQNTYSLIFEQSLNQLDRENFIKENHLILGEPTYIEALGVNRYQVFSAEPFSQQQIVSLRSDPAVRFFEPMHNSNSKKNETSEKNR